MNYFQGMIQNIGFIYMYIFIKTIFIFIIFSKGIWDYLHNLVTRKHDLKSLSDIR